MKAHLELPGADHMFSDKKRAASLRHHRASSYRSTCIGKGVDSFLEWHSGRKDRHRSTSAALIQAHSECEVAGEISDWNAEEFFPPHRLKRLDRYAQFAVVSAEARFRRRWPGMLSRKAAGPYRREFRHRTWRSLQSRRAIHSIFEERRSRRPADACSTGLWRLSPLQHRD